MSEQAKPDAFDRLVRAYERMLARIHEAFEKTERTEKEERPTFRELLHRARERMIELEELTREEADRVAQYVERDIEDAARYIAESGEDIRTWWRFDLDLIEQSLLAAFSRVADQTSLQLQQFALEARRASLYQTGEITGPGSLVCDECGAALHMHETGRIPPCPACGATVFKRAA